MSIIFILIIGTLFYILYKFVTITDLPNIDTKININKKNNTNTKINNSFNQFSNFTINSTQINNSYKNTNSSSKNSDDSPWGFIIFCIIITILAIRLYKKIFFNINTILIIAIITSVFFIAIYCIILKSKNYLSNEFIKYAIIQSFTFISVMIMAISPLFCPDNINELIALPTSFSTLIDNPFFTYFVLTKFIGIILYLFFFIQSFWTVYKKRLYINNCYDYKVITIITLISLLLTSGTIAFVLNILVSQSQNLL